MAEVVGETGMSQELGRLGCAVRGLEGGGLSEEEHREETGVWIWPWRAVSVI